MCVPSRDKEHLKRELSRFSAIDRPLEESVDGLKDGVCRNFGSHCLENKLFLSQVDNDDKYKCAVDTDGLFSLNDETKRIASIK
jgi:hypothetical protein